MSVNKCSKYLMQVIPVEGIVNPLLQSWKNEKDKHVNCELGILKF